jgi:hypothetical protein
MKMLYTHPHVAFGRMCIDLDENIIYSSTCGFSPTPMIVADPPLLNPWNKNGRVLNWMMFGGCLKRRVIVNCRAELSSRFRYSSLIISKREKIKKRKRKRRRDSRGSPLKNGPLHPTLLRMRHGKVKFSSSVWMKGQPSFSSSDPSNFPWLFANFSRLFANFPRLFVQVLPNNTMVSPCYLIKDTKKPSKVVIRI